MGKVPYLPFYASDWLGSRKVLLMTDAQRGIYITLIAHQWSDPSCSIPTDKKLLQKMLPGSKWKNIEYVVQECFEVDRTNEERARNARVSVEHTKAIGKSEAAKFAVKCREDKKTQQSNDERTMNERSSNQNHIQNQNHKKKNLKITVPAKTAVTDPRIKQVIDYFFAQCQNLRGFKPAINGGQDGKRVQEALKIMAVEDIFSCIDFFIPSKKADEMGCTLAIALSAHTLNLFRQGEGQNVKSRFERIFGVRDQRSNVAGIVHREALTGSGNEVVDGEASEVSEMEIAET